MQTGRISRSAFTDSNLKEWDYGDFEGKTTMDIRREIPGWCIWDEGARNGESIYDVAKRAEAVIQRATTVEGNVLLFSHGHLLRILAARWLELPPRDGRLFALATASISLLSYERDTRVIERWNNPSPEPTPVVSLRPVRLRSKQRSRTNLATMFFQPGA